MARQILTPQYKEDTFAAFDDTALITTALLVDGPSGFVESMTTDHSWSLMLRWRCMSMSGKEENPNCQLLPKEIDGDAIRRVAAYLSSHHCQEKTMQQIALGAGII